MKKNLLYRAAALGALPLLLAACSQQDNEPINVEGELVPLEISVSADTRTIIDGSTLPDLTSFGIFGVTQETGELQEDIERARDKIADLDEAARKYGGVGDDEWKSFKQKIQQEEWD